MEALQITVVPKALLWKRTEALKAWPPHWRFDAPRTRIAHALAGPHTAAAVTGSSAAMTLSLTNSALLSYEVLADAARLFDPGNEATPAELHALNSLIEAAALHEKLYVYRWPEPKPDLGPLADLFKWGLIESDAKVEECEAELVAMGLADVEGDVLEDRTSGGPSITYKSGRLAEFLQMLVDYERQLGFERMARLLDDDEEEAFEAAAPLRLSEQNLLGIDSWYRKTRALTTTATELGLHLYTGLLSRPYLLGQISVRRASALQVFAALKAEYDDFDDSDIPKWRRVEIPALTQQALIACKGDPKALANEVMRVRTRLAGFRGAITTGALAIRSAKTRAEKRRTRHDTDAALAALLEKVDKTSRLSHTVWDLAKNPFTTHVKVGDKLVEKDQLNQAIDKVVGLSDLWALLSTAPAMAGNAELLHGVFKAPFDLKKWDAARSVAQDLERVMNRDAAPVPPHSGAGGRTPRR
jgi:hypothetical protein